MTELPLRPRENGTTVPFVLAGTGVPASTKTELLFRLIKANYVPFVLAGTGVPASNKKAKPYGASRRI